MLAIFLAIWWRRSTTWMDSFCVFYTDIILVMFLVCCHYQLSETIAFLTWQCICPEHRPYVWVNGWLVLDTTAGYQGG